MVDIQTIFDAGSVRDGEQPGLANLTNGLLSHGAHLKDTLLSVDDITERFESVGARFSADTSKDYAELSLRTLTDPNWLTAATDTMQALINEPTFDIDEVARVRKQIMIGFEGRKESPETITNDLFYKTLYKGHPYALPEIGTEKSVQKISRDDLIRFYKKYYVANNALVTIVGDVDKAQAEKLAEKIVGQLPAGEKAGDIPVVKDLDQAISLHQEYPSSQTHIMVGQPGVSRKDKDYFVLYVGNHILGGSGFGSRIMQEIREKRGLAYSSYSYFYPSFRRGPFIIGLQTRNNKSKEALKVLRETLSKFIKEGPTAKELAHAKKNITGGFALRIDSNSEISNYLGVIGFYDLPLSYLKDFNQRVEAVTLEQIKDAFKRRIDPDKMITITVGQNVPAKK
jgi:zinc protease